MAGPRLIGAGLPRTGTKSLQVALERLLDGRCYHMHEVFDRPEHVPVWQAALDGRPPDWQVFLAGYAAAVDWPVSAFWRELADAFPDAPILLSVRADPQTWWRSADATVLEVAREEEPGDPEWHAMFIALLERRLTPDWRDPAAAMAAYERHNQAVRDGTPSERLVEWRPEDGWSPVCRSLGLPVPDEPFPRHNVREDWT